MTLSSGNAGFGGSFATRLSGMNHFSGKFTGLRAEELIGAWALPFMFEGKAHEAIGAYIARKP